MDEPRLPEGYYNLGIAKEKVGDYAGAIRDLKIYLASNPAESDAKQAKALVYEIEYRQEKDEKDKQELKRQADLKAAEEYEKFGWLLGTWNWERRFPAVNDNRSGILELRKDGNYIIPYYDGRP